MTRHVEVILPEHVLITTSTFLRATGLCKSVLCSYICIHTALSLDVSFRRGCLKSVGMFSLFCQCRELQIGSPPSDPYMPH